MSFEKLNRLAAAFYEARTDAALSDLYAEARQEFQTQNRRRVTASGFGDCNDADGILNDVVYKLTEKERIHGFGKQMATALKNARIDFFRSERSRHNHFELTIDSSDEDTPMSEVVDDQTVESIVMYRQRKKEADQLRKLIDFLSDPTQVDSDTTRIVSSFREVNADGSLRYSSITALAKALGLHHEVVKRKLRKLSRRYDANRFGDISEYLAV